MLMLRGNRVPVVAAVALVLAASADAATCPRTTTALTSSCESLCFQGRPCVAYAADTTAKCVNGTMTSCRKSAATGCAYACLKYGVDDYIENNIIEYSTFTFLMPIGTFVSNWEKNWTSAEAKAAGATSLPDQTSLYPSVGAGVVASIEPLTFRDATKTVRITGGTSLSGIRGRVANVVLESGVFGSATTIQSLVVANLKLKEALPSSFPPQLVNFSLINCGMSTIPNDLLTMPSLKRLDMSLNYYKEYPAKFGLPNATYLNLSSNNIGTFDGAFPALTTLDLADNLLTEIPAAVFSMPKLQYLDLRQNSFTSVQVSPTEFAFLEKLPNFFLSLSSGSGGTCTKPGVSKTVGGVAVCVTSSPNNPGSTTGNESPGNNKGEGTTKGGSSNTAALIGGIVGGLVAVLLVAGIVFYLRHNRPKSKEISRTFTPTPSGHNNNSTQRSGGSAESVSSLWTDQELMSLKLNSDDIEDVRRIGSGAFSVVFLVRYRQTRLAASKRLKKDELTWKNTQQFVSEVKLVHRLEHPRIVALIGVAWTIEADLQALFEYMANGDVRTYLEAPTRPKRWSREKVQIIMDVVEALVYVHSFTPPLVHRDLKSRNVLLDQQNRAKLSDFGVARFRSDQNTMTTGVGTGRWLAPEVISGNSDYDQSCDIFSFGVVMSEMDTHDLPYEDIRGPAGNRLADVALLQMVSAGKLVPTFSRTCPPDILKLASRCLAFDRNDRPSAVEVAYVLRTIMRLNEQHQSIPKLRQVRSTMFMLKKKKAPVDSSKQIKAIAWDITKVAVVFISIRAASVFLNQESY